MGERGDDDYRAGDRARAELSEFVSRSRAGTCRAFRLDKRLEEIQGPWYNVYRWKQKNVYGKIYIVPYEITGRDE